MKKKVSFVTVIAMSLLLAASPVFAGGAQARTAEDRVTITVAFPDQPTVQPGDRLYEYLFDKFNVELEIINLPWGQQTELLRTYIAAGDVPDVFATAGRGNTAHDEWVAEGIMADITDKVAAYPSIKAILDDAQYSFLQVDGRWYGYPRYFNGTTQHGLTIRKDWLDKVGMPVPETVDDFYNALVAFKQQNPGGVENVLPFAIESRFWLEKLQTRFTGINEWGRVGDTYRAFYVVDGYREFVKYMRRLRAEGLLDPDWPLGQNFISSEKMMSGRVGSTYFQIARGHFQGFYDGLLENVPDAELVIVTPPLEGPAGRNVTGNADFLTNVHFGARSRHIDRAMEVFDWLVSDEGKMLWRYGIEGVHYTKDSSGELQLNMAEYAKDNWDTRVVVGLSHPNEMERLSGYYYTKAAHPDAPYGRQFNEAIASFAQYTILNPALGFSHPEAIEIAPRVLELRTDYLIRFVNGELDIDTNWSRYLNDLNTAGYTRFEQLVNEYMAAQTR